MDNVFFENPPVLQGNERTQLQQIYGFLYNMSGKLNEAMLAAGVREGAATETDSAAARVAAEEALSFQSRAEFGVDLGEGLRDSHAESLGLTGDAAAVQVSLDVILTHQVGHLEGLLDLVLQGGNAKIFLIVTVVDHDLAAAGFHVEARDGGFSSA